MFCCTRFKLLTAELVTLPKIMPMSFALLDDLACYLIFVFCVSLLKTKFPLLWTTGSYLKGYSTVLLTEMALCFLAD